MDASARQCAREILETVPLVMRVIRNQVRWRRPTVLSLPQFRTLAFLDGADQASLSAAAEHLGLSLPAMSRLINGLVNHRLVERQTLAINRRQIALTLTAQGRAALENVRTEVRLRLAEVVENLPASEQKTLHRAMGILHKVFDKRVAPTNPLREVEP